jgi:cyclopropane fatty-acyl-phospholipid synthase-like methyltransferase
MTSNSFYDRDYYENGITSKKSLYENYRWLPDLTLPLAKEIYKIMEKANGFAEIVEPSILDYGCAKGYLVQAFRQLGFNSFGIDVSEYAINNALSTTKNYLRCLNLEFTSIPDEWKPIDYIIAKDVLEHLSYENLINQLKELRKLSSRIIVIVPLGNGEKYFIDEYENDPSHIIREDLAWWQKLLSDLGFDVKATYDVGNLKSNWKNHHQKGNGLLYTK